jgi:hypothetical protein
LPIAQRYSEYLRTLDLNALDVLAEWHHGIAFVGYAGAQRTRNTIKLSPPDTASTSVSTRVGFLEGFGRSPKHFEFYDSNSGERITGTIEKHLRDLPLRDEVHLGHRRKYRVEIRSVQVGSKPPRFTLTAFVPTEE